MPELEPTTRFRFYDDGGEPYRLEIPMEKTIVARIPAPFGRTGAALALGTVAILALAGMARGQLGSAAVRALTQGQRSALPDSDFAVPLERKYPINDLRHGQLALTYVMAPSNKRYRFQVMSRVFPRYPSLINWWPTTEKGREIPLTEQYFRDQIQSYRRKLRRASGEERTSLEYELAALQVLVTMTPHLKTLARRAARRAG
jgi:hypothetical protein